MEQAYKTALEIILAICKKAGYISSDSIITICQAVLNTESEN